jgi:hypothetical protein
VTDGLPIRRLDPGCGPARLRLLLRRAGHAGAEDLDRATCDGGVALYVWVASALALRAPVPPEAQEVLLDCLREPLVATGRRVAGEIAAAGEVGGAFLSVLDGAMAVLTMGPGDWQGWDLRTATRLPGPPRPPVEAVVYNLVELYRMHADRLRRTPKEAEHASYPGRPGEPGPSS